MLSVIVLMAGGRYFFKQPTISRKLEARDEVRKLMLAAKNIDSVFYMEGQIRVFDGEADSVIKESNHFRVFRKGHSYLTEFGHVQTICDGQLLVRVDMDNQTIRVSQNTVGVNDAIPFAVDAAFNDTAAFKTSGNVTENGSQRIMILKSDLNPEIKEMKITYDSLTYRSLHTEIQWWKDAVVWDTTKANRIWNMKIDYTYRKKVLEDPALMIQKIITRKNNKLITTKQYQQYKIESL